MRRCTRCFETKPHEEFYRHLTRPCGYMSACKACVKTAITARRKADLEASRAKARAYYRRNAAHIAVANHECRKRNRERTRPRRNELARASARALRRADPQRSNAYMKAWRDKNRERVNALARERQRTAIGRERSRRCTAIRRARKRACNVVPVDYGTIYARDGGRCWICWLTVPRSAAHFDHVMPLSKGGSHAEDNVRTACRPCNTRKSNLMPTPYRITRIGEEVRRLVHRQARAA